jgi:hypothetical protein
VHTVGGKSLEWEVLRKSVGVAQCENGYEKNDLGSKWGHTVQARRWKKG